MKRIKWINDKLATDKQKEYATSLLAEIVKDANKLTPATTDVSMRYAINFWNSVNLPDDLTATEATKLIDDLKYRCNCYALPRGLFEAIVTRVKKEKITAGAPAIMFTNFGDCDPLVELLKEKGKI